MKKLLLLSLIAVFALVGCSTAEKKVLNRKKEDKKKNILIISLSPLKNTLISNP